MKTSQFLWFVSSGWLKFFHFLCHGLLHQWEVRKTSHFDSRKLGRASSYYGLTMTACASRNSSMYTWVDLKCRPHRFPQLIVFQTFSFVVLSSAFLHWPLKWRASTNFAPLIFLSPYFFHLGPVQDLKYARRAHGMRCLSFCIQDLFFRN